MRPIDADTLIKDVDGDLLDGIAEARAIEKIENAPTVATDNNVIGKWVRVEDRLPEMLLPVLLYSNDGKMNVGLYNDLTNCFMVPYENMARITHWMPLPEPPIEEAT